jgi:hypothetical protein
MVSPVNSFVIMDGGIDAAVAFASDASPAPAQPGKRR